MHHDDGNFIFIYHLYYVCIHIYIYTYQDVLIFGGCRVGALTSFFQPQAWTYLDWERLSIWDYLIFLVSRTFLQWRETDHVERFWTWNLYPLRNGVFFVWIIRFSCWRDLKRKDPFYIIGISIINHPFWGIHIFVNTQMTSRSGLTSMNNK